MRVALKNNLLLRLHLPHDSVHCCFELVIFVYFGEFVKTISNPLNLRYALIFHHFFKQIKFHLLTGLLLLSLSFELFELVSDLEFYGLW